MATATRILLEYGIRAVGTPSMTRCACLEVPFSEVARVMREEGLSAEQAQVRTGCGSLCSACLPDLASYLEDRKGDQPAEGSTVGLAPSP
jgi:bacterioferritin-associated ferredoxin